MDHIAMFSQFNENGDIEVMHAVPGENGKRDGLIKTTLQTIIGRTEEDTVKNPDTGKEEKVKNTFDVEFSVFRYNDTKIANNARTLLDLWCRFNIPYDHNRLQEKIDLEDKKEFEAPDFYEHATKKYDELGKYRALKYTVRRNESIVHGRHNGKGTGLTCSMTYVLAYQVAELSPYVWTLEAVNNKLENGEVLKYNSDKYATYNADHLAPIYVRYLKSLGNDGSESKQDFYVTSLEFHHSDFNIHEFKHESFPIDCRSIGAAGIHYLFGEQDNWQALGILKLGPRKTFTAAQKMAYKNMMQENETRKSLMSASFSMLGLFGKHLGENTKQFARECRTKRNESPSDTRSAPNTPEKMNSGSFRQVPTSAPPRTPVSRIDDDTAPHKARRKLEF